MTSAVRLDDLITLVKNRHPDGDALERLGDAVSVGEHLGEHTDTWESALEGSDPRQLVVLSVDDDGRGFDLAALPSHEGHFGVRVLADLATDVGAVLRVSSSPDSGTRWRLAVPARQPS